MKQKHVGGMGSIKTHRTILKVSFSDVCLIKRNKVKVKEEKEHGEHSEILNNWVNSE